MNSPSNQTITGQIFPFDEQKCDSGENIYGDEDPILWDSPLIGTQKNINRMFHQRMEHFNQMYIIFLLYPAVAICHLVKCQ